MLDIITPGVQTSETSDADELLYGWIYAEQFAHLILHRSPLPRLSRLLKNSIKKLKFSPKGNLKGIFGNQELVLDNYPNGLLYGAEIPSNSCPITATNENGEQKYPTPQSFLDDNNMFNHLKKFDLPDIQVAENVLKTKFQVIENNIDNSLVLKFRTNFDFDFTDFGEHNFVFGDKGIAPDISIEILFPSPFSQTHRVLISYEEDGLLFLFGKLSNLYALDRLHDIREKVGRSARADVFSLTEADQSQRRQFREAMRQYEWYQGQQS